MNSKASNYLLSKLRIIEDLDYGLGPESVILDFGCGSGRRVLGLRSLGYQSYGCDFKFKEQDNADTSSLVQRQIIRLIQEHPYRLPFDDDTFDVVMSDQVFEHVNNYPESIAEISRVLKADGCCLHIFPSRYKMIEPHSLVPFATVLRSYPWLYIWAALGIRNQHQRDLSIRETVDRNSRYLAGHTNYLTKAQVRQHFENSFGEVKFCEELFLKYSKRGFHLYKLSWVFSFLPFIYSTFHSRVIAARYPRKVSARTETG